jgi:hypothetical protein
MTNSITVYRLHAVHAKKSLNSLLTPLFPCIYAHVPLCVHARAIRYSPVHACISLVLHARKCPCTAVHACVQHLHFERTTD